MLRAGGGDDIVNESRSLFRIGAVCEIARITGALVACHTLDVTPITVFAINTTTYALFPDKRIVDLGKWNDNVDDRPAHIPQAHRTSDLRP